jgi:thioredoxin-related protein
MNINNLEEIIENNYIVIFVFTSSTCLRCHDISERIKKHKGDIEILDINITENEKIGEKYSVEYVPSILTFEGKEIVKHIVGNQLCVDYLNKILKDC